MAKASEAVKKAIRTMPAEAIAGMIDVVLSATGVPSSLLFSALLSSFSPKCEEIMSEDQPSDAFKVAMLHLLRAPDSNAEDLDRMVQVICIPLLCAASSSSKKASRLFAEGVAGKCNWDYALSSLVPCSLNSIVTALPLRDGLNIHVDAEGESVGGHVRKYRGVVLALPVACQLVADLLNVAGNVEETANAAAYAEFLSVMINTFWNPSLRLLSEALDDSVRCLALQTLLPCLLRAHKILTSLKTLSEEGLRNLNDVWLCCKVLFFQGASQRRDAYRVLSMLAPFMNECLTVKFDVRAEPLFWEKLRVGLVDEDSLTRKRALQVLKIALKATETHPMDPLATMAPKDHTSSLKIKDATKRDRWAEQEAKSLGVESCKLEMQPIEGWWQYWDVFLLLYGILDEYGIHLVEAAWKDQMAVLMTSIASEKNGMNLDTPRHVISLNFLWISVLLERGFKHGNPQVRRMIVQSFLEMKWEGMKNVHSFIPHEFILGPLLYALNDPAQHKGFGLNGMYSSETGIRADRLFRAYTAALDLSSRVRFVENLSKASMKQPLCRAGLMTLASCMESAAGGSGKISCSDVEKPVSLSSDLLDSLRLVVENSRHHFNPNYRAKVCACVLKTVQTLVSLSELTFDKLSYFLSSFPRELLIHGGLLRSSFDSWLGPSAGRTQRSITDGLRTALATFLKPPDCKLSPFVISEDDIESWREEAERWARILSIGVTTEECQPELMLLVEQYAVEIYQRVYMPASVPEKILLLLQSLLKECPIITRSGHNASPSRKGEFKEGSLLSAVHLVNLLHAIMGELVSYAERCATVLWEYECCGPIQVPASVTGKLGGPSQRRLPSHAASSVIQAVLAVETLSECYIWYSASHQTGLQESIGSFLWKFCWKVLTASKIQEEVRAEFHLAGFEALASVCKALPFANTCTLIVSAIERTCLEGYPITVQPEMVVDALIMELLKVFEGVLKEGKLARSRRAVLARHKWACLDGLLSIDKIQLEAKSEELEGVIVRNSAISVSTLSIVLQDAIDSLGSANEDYLLPLFRCVRWLLHWGAMDMQAMKDQVMWELVQSGWACMADCNKRKVAPVTAFLSAFLHPTLFGDLDMHNVGDNKEGPLKWLLSRLTELGSRSPRTMRLTALHVTGLWLKYPATIIFYVPEIRLMCLHGGEAIDEELDGEILENEVTAREYAMLMQSSDPELQEAFANTEMFTRVAVAVMLDKLAELVEKGPTDNYGLSIYVTAAANSGRSVLLHLLEAAANDADLAKELYKKKSAIHRRKVRVWQMLCILSRFTDETTLTEVIRLLEQCLYRNNMPSVRQYIEIFAVQMYLRFPLLVKEHLVPLLCDYNMKTQALSSYVFIAANIVKYASPVDVQERMLQDVLPAMIPHMTSHHHNLRTFSQVLIYQMLGMCRSKPSINDSLGSKCLLAIASYLEKNMDCARLRSSVEEFLYNLEPSAASKARGIFCDRSDPSKIVEDRPFECVPVAVLDKVADFLNEAREELRESMAADAVFLSYGNERNPKKRETTNTTQINYQKKISPFTDIMVRSGHGESATVILKDMEYEDNLLLSTIETRGRELAKIHRGRQDLILVASLIDRIPNLAGLARTCEVFKAAALTVGDAKILEDRQFKLISVTAEQWVPIVEVAEAGLGQFLQRKKREGYTILGLEQTANSVAIDQYSFPKKAVLVLGREKEGIPVDIIQLLDACVEIPQLGVIRSLNVHVSGAIALWEYTRQHLQREPL